LSQALRSGSTFFDQGRVLLRPFVNAGDGLVHLHDARALLLAGGSNQGL